MPDVIVAGAGIAGMRAAVAAAQKGASVLLITRTHPTRSYSASIQDGINAAIAEGDSPEVHAQDTITAGANLADRGTVQAIAKDAPSLVEELDRLGVPFTRDGNQLAKVQLTGSTHPRTVFADDMTGHVLTQVMYEQVLKAGFQTLEEWAVVALAMEASRCAGVVALEIATGNVELFPAKAVVIATGGPRRLYEPSTASLACSGDGIALAFRAGARLVDMEMVQYHPYVVKDTRLALSEILNIGRGDGAQALSPVSDSVDLTTHPEIASNRFHTTRHRLNGLAGVNPTKAPVPVQPAMHRLLGGIAVDQNGATNVPGLYAAGECAGSTFHGARGMPGNFLLESLAMGKRAGEAAAAAPAAKAPAESIKDQACAELDALLSRPTGGEVSKLRRQLAGLMHDKAGQKRDAAGLQQAATQIEQMASQHQTAGLTSNALQYNHGRIHYIELGHLIDVAKAVVASARARKESRGVHVRTDFPNPGTDAKHVSVTWDGKAPATEAGVRS